MGIVLGLGFRGVGVGGLGLVFPTGWFVLFRFLFSVTECKGIGYSVEDVFFGLLGLDFWVYVSF